MAEWNIRVVDRLFDWWYQYVLERHYLKPNQPFFRIGSLYNDGTHNYHARFPTDWDALSEVTIDKATIPGVKDELAKGALSDLTSRTVSEATLHLDYLGNVHPCPLRPGKDVLLYFLNTEYVQEIGGEVFFYADDSRRQIIYGSQPKPNRALLFDGSLPYTVRPPSKQAVHPRLSITLVFDR